jgi:hypothetical protein
MGERIFQNSGIEIFKRHGRLVLRYLTGRSDQPVREVWISPEQARRAQCGECEAYEVIFEAASEPRST